MSDVALEFSAVTLRQGRRSIVEDVTLAVPRGAVYALLGRNGAGKSTLVRCALGLLPASSGSVRLFGEDVWRRRARLMARVGFVPEEPGAPPSSTVDELAAFCRGLYPRWDDAGLRQRLERFEVPCRAPFARLSRGQKGITLLALALAPGPELLILDDPTLGLDVVARRFVFEELVAELADRATTVFITTHDLAGIEGVADRVGILAGRRLVVEGALEDLKLREGLALEELFVRATGAATEAA